MTHQTAVLSDFDSYLESEYPRSLANFAEARETEVEDRRLRLKAFPFDLVLQVSFPELNFANRWCWQQFGPAHGVCLQGSEYPNCAVTATHSHEGEWMWYLLAKTDYDFGYTEWCFAQQRDRDRFREFFPQINWGENFPR